MALPFVVALADAALYRAEEEGRRRVAAHIPVETRS